MRHAGGILRHGQERNQEGVVRIGGGQMEMPGAGGAMAVFLKFQPQGRDGVTTQVFEGGMGHGFSSVDKEAAA